MDTPRFQPGPPGNIGIESKVTITCETKGTFIYYTVDGTDPDEDSIPYEKGVGVPVQPGQVLKARAYRKNWDPSPIAEAVYGVEPVELPIEAPPIPEDALPDESSDAPASDDVDGDVADEAEESTPADPAE